MCCLKHGQKLLFVNFEICPESPKWLILGKNSFSYSTALIQYGFYNTTALCSCSGAQGEYTGLAAIRAYLSAKGERHRSVSVIMCLEITFVKCFQVDGKRAVLITRYVQGPWPFSYSGPILKQGKRITYLAIKKKQVLFNF